MTMREKLARKLRAGFYEGDERGWEAWTVIVDEFLDVLMEVDDHIEAHGKVVPEMINAGTWWIKGLKPCFQDMIRAIKEGK